jgi:hypothetical protein
MTDYESRLVDALKKSNNCLAIARVEFEHAGRTDVAEAIHEQFEENRKLIVEVGRG